MIYFTRDSYEKMQIRGRFPIKNDNKENLIEQLEEFNESCSSYDKVYYELLLKHIPEVKDLILEGKKFTDEEVADKLYASIYEMANEWKDICKGYKEEYENIKHKLPITMQELRKYYFHDNKVLWFKKDINDDLVLELDRYSIIFKNVTEFEIMKDIVGDTWLYEEVHLSDSGKFEFHVLLYSSEGFLNLNELKIIAEDVSIEEKDGD